MLTRMWKSRSALGALTVLLVPFLCALRQPPPGDEAETRSYQVPYRMSETMHLIVRAKFNGKGPFHFIVDTGAPALFVTTEVATRVGVDVPRDGWATFDRMEIEGGAVLRGVKGRVEDIFQLRGMNGLGLAGVKLDGVIGYNVLARYRLRFDLSRPTMTWTELDFVPALPPRLLGGENQASAPPELTAMGGLMQLAGSLLGRSPNETPTPRGFLGLTLADLPDRAEVTSVLPDSPAARAGLRPGDLIVKFGDHSVRSAEDVLARAAGIGPGEAIAIAVERDGEQSELWAETGEGF
jgi:hypothetical protein